MNGFDMGGRPLRVNEAREREARPPRKTAAGNSSDSPRNRAPELNRPFGPRRDFAGVLGSPVIRSSRKSRGEGMRLRLRRRSLGWPSLGAILLAGCATTPATDPATSAALDTASPPAPPAENRARDAYRHPKRHWSSSASART